jgi:hypothetical protein
VAPNFSTPRLSPWLRVLAAATALIGAGASAQIVSGNDAVRIEVRVQSGQDRKDIAKSTADTVTQHKTLNIALSGKAKSPENRTGKWTAYGRSIKGNDITALESGEFKVDLASGAQRIESKKVSTTYTPEHSVVSTSRSRGSGGNRGTSRTTAKKVAAEGTKFIGFGVVVKDGDRIVGEYFDPAGLKTELAK